MSKGAADRLRQLREQRATRKRPATASVADLEMSVALAKANATAAAERRAAKKAAKKAIKKGRP